MLGTIVQIVSIVSGSLAILFSLLLFFKKRKQEKLKEEQSKASEIEKAELQKQIDNYQNDITILQGTLEMLQGLPEKIREAENLFGAGNGGAKKMLVISEAQTECLTKGLPIDKQKISDYTENILDTPKKK